MKAIVDILKDNGLYTFMALKERLLDEITLILSKTEYANKYGLSGSFTSSDQTISIVVGILADQEARSFISLGIGAILNRQTSVFREYTYGINITGINDEEVKSLSRLLYYGIINRSQTINRDLMVKIDSNIMAQPVYSGDVGNKRMWRSNMYLNATIGETYHKNMVDMQDEEDKDKNNNQDGLNVEGYDPPRYSSCTIIKEWEKSETPNRVAAPHINLPTHPAEEYIEDMQINYNDIVSRTNGSKIQVSLDGGITWEEWTDES